jgi:hypothetical protein
MDYTRLENLRNTYPAQTTTDLNNIKTFYSKEEGYVRKYGKDRTTNYLDFKTYPLDKLNVLDPNLYPYVDFNFIVQFYDEEEGFVEEWTSDPFKEKLLKAKEDGNPYFNKFTVPIIPMDYGELKNHHRINKLSIGELYSETKVTKTIATIEEMLLHIQWLVVFTDGFRNTESGKIISDPIYPIDGIGTWITTHDPQGTFGMGWSDYLKQTLNDKEFAIAITSDTLKPKEIIITRPSDKSLNITQTPQSEPSPPEPPSPPYTPSNYTPDYSYGGYRNGGVYYPTDYYGPGYYNDGHNSQIQFRNDYYNIR